MEKNIEIVAKYVNQKKKKADWYLNIIRGNKLQYFSHFSQKEKKQRL